MRATVVGVIVKYDDFRQITRRQTLPDPTTDAAVLIRAALAPLAAKWAAFSWTSRDVDGHDMAALVDLLRNVPDGSGRPVALVAHTVKGKGVSFMEDDNNWHYRIPKEDEVDAALAELGLAPA